MNYTNELGSLQQAYSTTETGAAGAAAGRIEQSMLSTAARNAATRALATAGDDQAALNTAGSLMAQALGGSDVRMDKVLALQRSIMEETYSVSAADVADKLMNYLMN